MVRATRRIVGASGTALDGGVHFPGEFFIIVDAFAPGLILNFGSLAYVIDCYDEFCPPMGVAPAGDGSTTLPPPPCPPGVGLPV